MDENSQNIILTNNSRTTWPTWILMLFLCLLDNLLWDAYIIFQKWVDNFEIEYKYHFVMWIQKELQLHFACFTGDAILC